MPEVPVHRTDRDILILAARALGAIDRHGPRGLTMISTDQIEAMALSLAMLGLMPIPPEMKQPPERLVAARMMEF
jgi:hypothetical protein